MMVNAAKNVNSIELLTKCRLSPSRQCFYYDRKIQLRARYGYEKKPPPQKNGLMLMDKDGETFSRNKNVFSAFHLKLHSEIFA